MHFGKESEVTTGNPGATPPDDRVRGLKTREFGAGSGYPPSLKLWRVAPKPDTKRAA